MNTEAICRSLYRQAFHDPDTSFENLLFSDCFGYCKIAYLNSVPASMLFALPCEIVWRDEKLSAEYIYAAATHKKHRNKGLMSELIKKTVSDKSKIYFLRPATDSLTAFYEKLGFKAVKTNNRTADVPEILPLYGFKRLADEANAASFADGFTLMYYGSNAIKHSSFKFLYSME